MPSRLRLITLLLLTAITNRLSCATPHDFEVWDSTIAFVSLEETKRYQLFLELQPRLGDNWQRMASVLTRVALVYNATSNLSLFGGYAWFPTFYDSNYYRSYRDEQRLWQQLLYTHDLWDITWQHRIRQEQRWIEHTNGVSNRTRYMLRGSLPLNDENTFGITAFDEFMVNLNSIEGGPWSGYDRNRFFVGPYWQVGVARYEIGYLGEHAKRFGSDERWVSAIAALAILHF